MQTKMTSQIKTTEMRLKQVFKDILIEKISSVNGIQQIIESSNYYDYYDEWVSDRDQGSRLRKLQDQKIFLDPAIELTEVCLSVFLPP